MLNVWTGPLLLLEAKAVIVLESIPPLRNTPIGTSLTSRILTASSTSERTPSIASDSESLRGELAALSGLQKVAARCFSDPSALPEWISWLREASWRFRGTPFWAVENKDKSDNHEGHLHPDWSGRHPSREWP